MQDSLPAGGLRLYREGVEPSGSLRKVSGYIPFSFPGLFLSQWVCGRRRAFPRFPSSLGKRGKRSRRQSRSSTYPQAFLVNLARRAVTEALVRALCVVKVEPRANAGLGLGHRRIGVEVYLFVFQAAPQSLDEDVVHAPALAIH